MSNTENKFLNRVFGITMVKSSVSNYNADFTKQPRTLPSGTVYATDKALKYTVKHLIKKYFEEIELDDDPKKVIERKHNRVMYFRNFDENMKPRTLGETYKKMFGDLPKKAKENKGDSFFLFYTDGLDVFGLIPSKPKDLNKDFWASLKDTDEEKFQFKSRIEKLFEKKNKARKITDVKELSEVKSLIDHFESDQNNLFFAIDVENKFSTIEINSDNFESFEVFANEIDNMATGGFDKYEILKNLLKCIDVRLFGSTFADQTNISIHGPVQITHGIDRFGRGSELRFTEQIMSPFRNSNEKSADNDATTLGTQSQLEEGHYVHHFSINPSNLNTHNQNLKDDEKVFLDTLDIEILKNGLKKGVTDYDSASKKGSENELFLWVELKENSMLVLPNLQSLVDVKSNNGKTEVDLTKVAALLESLPKKKDKNDKGEEIGEDKSQINKIELCYTDIVTDVIGLPENNQIQGVTIDQCSLL